MLAMKTIWSNEEAEYHGEFVNFDPIWSYPKPVQEGGPPIWIGANSEWVFDRLAEYADGWMPIGGLGSGNMDKLKIAFDKVDRSVNELDMALFGAPSDIDQLKGRIEQGFDHLIFNLPSDGPEKVLPLLDKYAELKSQVQSQ